MIHILDFVFICCLFLNVETVRGQILPPSNLSLIWDKDFNFNFSWAPPPHSMENCEYRVTAKSKAKYSREEDTFSEPHWMLFKVLEGGYLELSVQTVCEDQESDVVLFTVPDEDLVKNIQCNIVTLKLTRCSWLKPANISDLRFFYRLYNPSMSINDKPPPMQECPSYRDHGDIRSGCDLQANPYQTMNIYINGTVDGRLVRNTFSKQLIDHVKPPALDWNITETKSEFIISWTRPEVELPWTYILNYTECKTPKKIEMKTGTLHKVPHCQYWMSIKAKYGLSETPWSKELYFAADTDQTPMVYAVVIIPLVFAGLAVFVFVCCRKNKENIFPRIPEPRNLLSDISNNNNNKYPVHNLYIPEEEEEDNCKITLVMDPQTETDKSLQ